MRILCADSAVATMNDQLRLLIRANASTELYRLALGRRNEGGATCPFALNLPIAIRTLRNVLISAFHNHLVFNSESPMCQQHEICDRCPRAVFQKCKHWCGQKTKHTQQDRRSTWLSGRPAHPGERALGTEVRTQRGVHRQPDGRTPLYKRSRLLP